MISTSTNSSSYLLYRHNYLLCPAVTNTTALIIIIFHPENKKKIVFQVVQETTYVFVLTLHFQQLKQFVDLHAACLSKNKEYK